MPSAPTPLFHPRWLAVLAALASLAAPALAHATAVDAYYERAVMAAADQHCRLFTP